MIKYRTKCEFVEKQQNKMSIFEQKTIAFFEKRGIIIGFSLLNCLEFFVFRKMKSSSTINHPLCGCESNVIQKKLPFRVQ